MRVTCPKCSTEYEIDINVLPETGRVVKCWKCAHDWVQTRPPLEELPKAQEPASTVGGGATSRRELNPKFARVLQEEAERERRAREQRQDVDDHASKSDVQDRPDGQTDPKKTKSSMAELFWPFPKADKVSDSDRETTTSAASGLAADHHRSESMASAGGTKQGAGSETRNGDPVRAFKFMRRRKAADDPDGTHSVNDDFFIDWDEADLNDPDFNNMLFEDLDDLDSLDDDVLSVSSPTHTATVRAPRKIDHSAPKGKKHKVPVPVDTDAQEEPKAKSPKRRRKRRPFRKGFFLAAFCFLIATLVYYFAPQIIEKFAQTEPILTRYVSQVDEWRGKLSDWAIPSQLDQENSN